MQRTARTAGRAAKHVVLAYEMFPPAGRRSVYII